LGLTPDDGLKKPVAFSLVLRLNSHAAPRNWLVPLRKVALITAPPARPNSALKLLVWTLNSSTASGDTCTTWFEKPWLLVPYELLSMPSRMKLLSALRMPLTLNDASRDELIDYERTPGLNSARSAYERPFSGRLTICSRLITWPRSLESVSSSLVAPTTSIFSPTPPTCRARSTRCRALTVTITAGATAVAKPDSSA